MPSKMDNQEHAADLHSQERARLEGSDPCVSRTRRTPVTTGKMSDHYWVPGESGLCSECFTIGWMGFWL